MIRSIPDIRVTDQATRDALEAMKEIIEVMLGRRGSDPDDHVLTRGDSSTIVRLFEALNTGLSHDTLADVDADDHHAQSHTVVSHSDTTATGAELETLTDNSIADALHRHSELVASDGTPDPVLSINVNGIIDTNGAAFLINSLGTGNRYAYLDLVGDDTNPYGFRFLRANTGENASTQLLHRGTGTISVTTLEAGAIVFQTSGYNNRLVIAANGKVSLSSGTSINEFSTDDTLAGDSDDAVPTEQAVKGYVDGVIHTRSHTLISTDDHTAGNWKLFASNGSGEITEITHGADGKVLTGNGVTAAPTWEDATGGSLDFNLAAALGTL